ncbi:hypothetical protein [Mycolicibacterium elephantis]|uniref:hypothetical protein n=1 Tax=Mycolicibacterium elephantis TaxID=81858 RepID=UPI000A8E475B|nr:hypothetical protein [Mycolicibacterium elephantis]
MNYTDDQWQRLGRLIDERLDALGVDASEVERLGGPKPTKLREIRNKRAKTLRKSLRPGLEKALSWSPGDIETVLRGGEPTPTPMPEVDLKDIDPGQRGGIESLQARMRRSEIMQKPESERTPEELAFVEAYDAAHPRRLDPSIWPSGEYRTPGTIFDDWHRTRNRLMNLTLEYAHARGIRFEAAEDELPHVLQMATDIQLGTGRPWTPPWDPGPDFLPDEQPWKAEFWQTRRAVDGIYELGHTYDLKELRARRAETAEADAVWAEDARRQRERYNRDQAKVTANVGDDDKAAQRQLHSEALLGHYVDMWLLAIEQQNHSALVQQARAILGDLDPEREIQPEIADDLYVRYIAARHSTPYQSGDPKFHAATGLTAEQHEAATERYRRERSEMILFDGRIRTAGAEVDVIADAIHRATPPGHRKGRAEHGDAGSEENQDLGDGPTV